MSSHSDAAIDVKALAKRFGKTTAVNNLSIAVRKGTTFGRVEEVQGMRPADVATLYFSSCIVIGMGSFAGGTAYYLLRVEP